MSALNQFSNQEQTQPRPYPVEYREPTKSEAIGALAQALAKAQGEITNALKDKDNPFFKSTYADLASVWDACREPLSKNGLSVTQTLGTDQSGRIALTTLLMHSSGEWISSVVPIIPVKQDPQSVGSAITYMRRFSLSALVGVAPSEKPTEDDLDEDDDGNAASGRAQNPGPRIAPTGPSPIKPKADIAPPQKPQMPGPSPDQLRRLFAIAKSAGLATKDDLKDWIRAHFHFTEFSLTQLNPQQYQAICEELEVFASESNDSDETFVQAELAPAPETTEAIKVPHPNAVPEPQLPTDDKNQWFKNRKV